MMRMKDRWRGDTFILTGTYKVGGVPTAITDVVSIGLSVQTTAGTFELSVVAYPDQTTNVGKFQAGSGDTSGWGIGSVQLQGVVAVAGDTLIPDITNVSTHTPFAQFTLKEPI